MVGSEELFTLIKSMSKSERRYFNIYSSMHVLGKKNSYMKLYEFIAKQKTYDEGLVKKVFSNESFIKHLPVVKNYLYQLILKSMRGFNDGASVDITLKNYLIDIEFLHQKTLYKSCRKILKKAKQLATVHDKFEILLQILRWEMKIFYHDKGYEGKKGYEEIKKYQTAVADTMKRSNNLLEYEIASRNIWSIYLKEGELRSKREMTMLKKIIKGKLYRNEHYPCSFSAKIQFYDDNGLYWYMLGDHNRAYTFYKKQLSLIEAHPERLNEQAWPYICALQNILLHALELKRYDELAPTIKKMRNAPKLIPSANTEHIQKNIFIYSYLSEIHGCILLGQLENASSIIKEIESGMVKYEGKIASFAKHTLYYNIAYVQFIRGYYDKALHPLYKILNEEEKNTSPVLACAARMLNIILHYELNNEELLPYMLKSITGFLSKRKRLFKIEALIIDFFKRKLPGSQNRKESIKKFTEFKKELLNIMADPFEAKILEYFDLLSWVESKIESNTFLEILKMKSDSI